MTSANPTWTTVLSFDLLAGVIAVVPLNPSNVPA
jgi:hypothetical protein